MGPPASSAPESRILLLPEASDLENNYSQTTTLVLVRNPLKGLLCLFFEGDFVALGAYLVCMAFSIQS